MSSPLRVRPYRGRSFGPAKISPLTLALLVALRCYALAAIVIAVYAFFRSL